MEDLALKAVLSREDLAVAAAYRRRIWLANRYDGGRGLQSGISIEPRADGFDGQISDAEAEDMLRNAFWSDFPAGFRRRRRLPNVKPSISRDSGRPSREL